MENALQERDLDELPAHSRNDVAFLEKTIPSVRHREDGMLEFALPFADESDPVFATTKGVARSRTQHTLDDLRRKNPIMFQSSLAKFAKNVQVENPRFIPVSPKDRKRADGDGKVYWIPLFSVWQKDKARIVFDAKASNGKGTCLNDKLLQGPDRNNSLRGVVVRFRCHPYAVKSDVANMFHNIRVKDPHPNYLRFFWYRDNDPSKELI